MGRKATGSVYKKTANAAKFTVAFRDPASRKTITQTAYTDLRASRKLLDRLITDAKQRAEGIVDRSAGHRKRPLAEHVAEYLEHCDYTGESPVHLKNKRTQLRRLLEGTGASRLSDLTPNAVEKHLQELSKCGRVARLQSTPDKGLSARSINQHRATAVAFLEWCVRCERLPDNPLKVVPKLDESRDRRHERRAFEASELQRLFEVSPQRRPIYLFLVLTGLRRNEAKRITWGDVFLDDAVLRVRAEITKTRKQHFVPLNAQVLEELRRFRPAKAASSDRVLASVPNYRTVRRDLERAAIERVDADGRHLDLHALRTTTGTMLARAGVAPQAAMRLLRHSDVKITMKHYTKLDHSDDARAAESLPRLSITVPGGKGARKEVPEEVKCAPEDAPEVAGMHDRQSPETGPRLTVDGGDRAQTLYTSALGTEVHQSAKGLARIGPKPLLGKNLRAIGAVG